jgi:hypothetical protein
VGDGKWEMRMIRNKAKKPIRRKRALYGKRKNKERYGTNIFSSS